MCGGFDNRQGNMNQFGLRAARDGFVSPKIELRGTGSGLCSATSGLWPTRLGLFSPKHVRIS